MSGYLGNSGWRIFSLVPSHVEERPVLPRLDRLLLTEQSQAIVARNDSCHQHPTFRGVQEPGAERRVPVLQEQVDALHCQGQQLANGLRVGIQGHGSVADGIAGIFVAAFEDRPLDDDGVLRQRHFEDGRAAGVQLGPLVVLEEDDLHRVVVVRRRDVRHHLLHAEQRRVLK